MIVAGLIIALFIFYFIRYFLFQGHILFFLYNIFARIHYSLVLIFFQYIFTIAYQYFIFIAFNTISKEMFQRRQFAKRYQCYKEDEKIDNTISFLQHIFFSNKILRINKQKRLLIYTHEFVKVTMFFMT